MSRERRIRDEDGDNVYYVIDEPTVGAGVFDTIKNVTTKVASKLTGKAAKKIAEKAIEKGAEKVGEKTGQLIGEKIYDRFRGASPRKGDQIIKELQKINQRGKNKGELEGLASRSISQQFDELLKL